MHVRNMKGGTSAREDSGRGNLFEKTHRFLSLDIAPDSLAVSPCKSTRTKRRGKEVRVGRKAEECANKENYDEEG